MHALQRLAVTAMVLLILADTALAQRPGTPQVGPDVQSLTIRVVLPDGRSGPQGLRVELADGRGLPLGDKLTDSSGEAHFGLSLIEGSYQVVVRGSDIEDASFFFQLHHREGSSLQIVQVESKPPADGVPKTPTTTVSVSDFKVPGNAFKEFKRGTDALGKRDWDEARKRLEKAIELYPNYGGAYNNLGVVYMNHGDAEKGRAAFEKAVAINRNYAPGYVNLARIASSGGKYPEAEEYLKKAVRLDPRNGEALFMLAESEFMNRHYDDAIRDARAVHSLPHRDYAEAHYICAMALQATERTAEAREEYKIFLAEAPRAPEAEQARQALQSLEEHMASATSAPEGFAAVAQMQVASLTKWDEVAQMGASSSSPVVAFKAKNWAPPDVDEVVPPVSSGIPCPLHEVMRGVSLRAKELMDNLQQFSATERIEHVKVDKAGNPGRPALATFKYVVEIRARTGGMAVEEYRDGSSSNGAYLGKTETTGLAAHALMFHPSLIDDLAITCEGLGSILRGPAWQLHFEQRPGRPPRFRHYITSKGSFPVELRGRVWVAVDSYQVMRMETDLAKPVDQIALKKDHVTIDYRPVEFSKRKVQLWLPQTTDLYLDFAGQRSHQRHSFSDFELFWVDVAEKIREPEVH